MSAAENKQLMRNIFASLAEGDSQTLIDSMDDNIRWKIAAEGAWSRTFESKQAVITQLFGLLQTKIATRLRILAYRFIAENDLVVVEARGKNNISKSGVPYDNSYCFVFRIAEGKVQEVTEYSDTELGIKTLGGWDS
jgi:ketosteroid isomerase-like protein